MTCHLLLLLLNLHRRSEGAPQSSSITHPNPAPCPCRYGRKRPFLFKALLRRTWTLQQRGIAFYIVRM